MILTEITPGKQMLLNGVSCRAEGKVVRLLKAEEVVCLCDFVATSCDYEEFAFAYPDDEFDTYRNDFKSILITLLDDSSTFEFFLVDSAGKEWVLDETLGKLYQKGFNALQPLKVGFTIDWLKVYNNEELGGGIYTIRIKQTDFGEVVSADSHNFKLMLYSPLASNGTVKIRTIQKGVHLNGEDYDGMAWENMNRIVGEFGNEEIQNEISRLKDANYKDYDVQNEYHYQYTLETNLLPSPIADLILNSDIKTDEIFISNYNIYAYRQYRELEVVAEGSVEPSADYRTNRNKKFNIIFEDKSKNIKRNFV